jgi:hypothetical protein
MKAFTMACFLCLILFAAGAGAGELKVIELKDGSVITGEVLSLSGGIYTVKSDALGAIRLEESKIRVIRSKAPAGSAAPGDAVSGSGGEVRTLQEKMMSDKEVMSMIQSLQDDAEFKKLLEDPETVKAVQAGDVAALMANPQFMKLLNNPTVQDIQKKVK